MVSNKKKGTCKRLRPKIEPSQNNQQKGRSCEHLFRANGEKSRFSPVKPKKALKHHLVPRRVNATSTLPLRLTLPLLYFARYYCHPYESAGVITESVGVRQRSRLEREGRLYYATAAAAEEEERGVHNTGDFINSRRTHRHTHE